MLFVLNKVLSILKTKCWEVDSCFISFTNDLSLGLLSQDLLATHSPCNIRTLNLYLIDLTVFSMKIPQGFMTTWNLFYLSNAFFRSNIYQWQYELRLEYRLPFFVWEYTISCLLNRSLSEMKTTFFSGSAFIFLDKPHAESNLPDSAAYTCFWMTPCIFFCTAHPILEAHFSRSAFNNLLHLLPIKQSENFRLTSMVFCYYWRTHPTVYPYFMNQRKNDWVIYLYFNRRNSRIFTRFVS